VVLEECLEPREMRGGELAFGGLEEVRVDRLPEAALEQQGALVAVPAAVRSGDVRLPRGHHIGRHRE
jgi:hypothetical protein